MDRDYNEGYRDGTAAVRLKRQIVLRSDLDCEMSRLGDISTRYSLGFQDGALDEMAKCQSWRRFL